MLRQLPRSLLQRATSFPKCVVTSRSTTVFPVTKLPFCFCESVREVANSAPINPAPFHKSKSQTAIKGFTSSYRLKSTNPEKKRKKETVVSKNDGEVDKSEQRSSHNGQTSPIVSEHIEIKPARQKMPQDAKDLAVRSVEEDEKSKRRYEKEDPPEEERHKYHKKRPERAVNKALMRTDYFDNMKGKSKEDFQFAIELFKEGDVHLRGHVEFIYVALREMKKFGVHKDLETYKKIIDIFPKGRMIQTNMFQVEFMHYPKHQQCAIDVLEQMEDNAVIPDTETHQLLTNIFGTWSFPMRKASRMSYWMPKFKNLSPWKLPEELPDNALELAKLAVERMTSIDLTTKISVFDCAELDDAYDLTWIVSGQSSDQQKLIENLPSNRPIYVEGAFRVWMRNVCMNYFILRAEPREIPKEKNNDEDDVGNLHAVFEEEYIDKALRPIPTVHEQDDGTILGVCCTGSSSRDSVVSWIRFLEQTNPRLGQDISVLFTLKSPIGPTDDIEILSFRDIEELKKLGKHRDPFTEKSDALSLDPGMPDLRQVGVWTESESKFPNWPHHFHAPDSISMKNKLDNERILSELESKEKQRPEEIGGENNTSKTKQIK